jgi:hypothetical protein
MANSFKNYHVKNANTAAQTIFTAGAGVQATVIGMSIANMTTAPISANVFITAGGTDYFMVKEATIAVGGALVPIGGDQKLVLEATDAIKVSATANADVILSVLEIS